MALKLFPIPFPISAPPPNSDSPQTHRPPTEIRFSRWNNANAEKFNNRRRAQQEIEDDIRRHRRFNSAANIIDTFDLPNAAPTSDGFKSVGTPSSPSTPSIPGKKSKYSKPQKNNPNPPHPAFRRTLKITKLPQAEVAHAVFDRNANIRISDDGLSYVVNDAPFEFKYSYTETPKVKPLKLREAPFTPFGPTTMARPWTGRAPLPPSKKKLKEFDSFQLPPANKKGVKPVQAPGPFRPGTGPRYVKTREEIIGEPLTKEEIKDLINGCLKAKRQLNMGRDGLTHNMLDNIHAHWKRRRVCKIRCKGVCTVDMENVCQQLEEKTGGKIIFRQGGTLYLFRGRNYNYRTRPYFPLMLWKPITPVYPRLIQQAPEGLTLEEASEMRKKGRKLIPICKLAKNGVYCNLVNEVREAFEECELVRINCQGINGSDYRKIGAKLRDLVPCVLISFEREHILLWRGRDWKSSFTKNDGEEDKGSAINVADLIETPLEEMATLPENGVSENALNVSSSLLNEEQKEAVSAVEIDEQYADMDDSSITMNINEIAATTDDCSSSSDNGSEAVGNMGASKSILNNTSYTSDTPTATITVGPDATSANYRIMEKLQVVSEDSHDTSKPEKLNMPHMEGVLQLWKQALESGSAVVVTDADMNADTVYQRAVAFAQTAPPSPVFRIRPRKVVVQKSEKQENGNLEVQEVTTLVPTVSKRNESAGKSFKRQKKKDYSGEYLDVPPHGSLKVDELAKLLA